MFFRLIDAAAEVSILSCRLPFQHERCHLFEGSEGKFDMLLADLRKLESRGEDNLIVEIKCHLMVVDCKEAVVCLRARRRHF